VNEEGGRKKAEGGGEQTLPDLRCLIRTFACKELGGNLFGQLLAHHRHFGWCINSNPHAATGDLQNRHDNFLTNKNALTNFPGYNQHVAISQESNPRTRDSTALLLARNGAEQISGLDSKAWTPASRSTLNHRPLANLHT